MEPVIAAQGLVKRYGEVVAVARYDEQGPGVDSQPSNDRGGAKQERGRKSCSIYLRCASGDELAEAIKRAFEGREHVVMVG